MADNSKTKTRSFQNKWLKEFTWLTYEDKDKKMKCKTCVEAYTNRQNKNTIAFASGSKNFQRCALFRHQKGNEHIVAKNILNQRKCYEVASDNVHQKSSTSLKAQIRTALFLAKEDISDRKFDALLDLQKRNGCKALEDDGRYTHHSIAAELQKSISYICKEDTLKKIKASPYLGLMLDESLDIAVQKKMVLFFKILVGGKACIEFATNIELKDGKAETIYNAVLNYLEEINVPVKKISGLGTDGASVMTGRHNGLAVRLQMVNGQIVSVWCVAHKLALVAHWASKEVPYFVRYEETLIAIYNFYKYSAVRYNKLRELKNLMNQKVKRFKKPTQVRWLSTHEAVEAVYSAWTVLILSLEHEAATDDSEGANKARGMLRNVKKFVFIATTCLLSDILTVITKCSKIFQKDVIDIDQTQSMLSATVETIKAMKDQPAEKLQILLYDMENNSTHKGTRVEDFNQHQVTRFNKIKKDFIDNIVSQVKQRFPEDDMQVLKDLNTVLNPSKVPQLAADLRNHGLDSLERLIDKYSGSEDVDDEDGEIDANDARNSFLQFKFFLNANRDKSLSSLCETLMDPVANYTDVFPTFVTLAQILMTIPITSVPCERGFSTQNRIHNSLRNKLSPEAVECKMHITNAAKQPSFDEESVCDRAVQKFQDLKKRRK